MNETRNSTPLFVIAGIIFAAVALVIAIIFAGADLQETTDRWNAKLNVLVWAFAISMVTIAASFPIRQWRRKDDVGERHYTHDGTKTIKEVHWGLPPQRQPQLTADPFAFPAMTRAAYAAGAANAGSGATVLPAEQHYTPIPTADGYAVWSNAMSAEAWDGEAPEAPEATSLPTLSPLPEDVPAPAGWDGEITQ